MSKPYGEDINDNGLGHWIDRAIAAERKAEAFENALRKEVLAVIREEVAKTVRQLDDPNLRKFAANSDADSRIQEQEEQIEALKRNLLEATADKRKKAMEAVHDLNQIGGLQEENARLKAEVERLTLIVGADLIDREHGMCCDASAQVERLTKAGDAMMGWIDRQHDNSGYPFSEAWEAAKQGGQP